MYQLEYCIENKDEENIKNNENILQNFRNFIWILKGDQLHISMLKIRKKIVCVEKYFYDTNNF